MTSRFPTVSEFILDSKKRHRRNGHKQFARSMQQLESNLIIEGVCGTLMKSSPLVSVLTVHDALLCDEPNANKVETTFSETLF
jgi:hypothetical protein